MRRSTPASRPGRALAAGTFNVADASPPEHRRLQRVPQRHHLLRRPGQAGQPHPLCGHGAVHGLPHQHRLRGDAHAGQHPRQRTEHDHQLRAVPWRSGGQLCDSGSQLHASSACRPTTFRPATACDSCHVGAGSSVATLPVPNGAKFSGSRMNHAGITNNCVACHVPAGTAANFIGITAIVGQPPTSPVGAGSHIPVGYHLRDLPPGHAWPTSAGRFRPTPPAPPRARCSQTPAPTGAQIHAGVTSGCSACHEANSVWMGVTRLSDRPDGHDRERPVHGLPDPATRSGGHLQRGRRGPPEPPVTAASATAAPCSSAAGTSRPTTSPTPPLRSARPATPTPTTR